MVSKDHIVLYGIVYRFFEMIFSEKTPPFIQLEFAKACEQGNSIFQDLASVQSEESVNLLNELKKYFKANSFSDKSRNPMPKELLPVAFSL